MGEIIRISEFKARRRLRLAAADELRVSRDRRAEPRSGHVSDVIPVDWRRFGIAPALLTDPDEAA